MKFNLVGNTEGLQLRVSEPPAIKRARALLSSLKDGDLLTSLALTTKLRLSYSYVSQLSNYLPEFCAIVKHKRYFGNPATIIQFKKEFKS